MTSTIDKLINYTPTFSNEDKKNNNKMTTHLFYKYSKGISLAESILIDNHPFFLQIQNGKPVLSETIEMDNQVIVPPDKSSYLSKEYIFSSKKEIEQYIKRAQKETLDS